MKLYERLGLTWQVVDPQAELESLSHIPNPIPEDQRRGFAWIILQNHEGAALRSYLNEEFPACRKHATEALTWTKEFFFGIWRSETLTDDGIIDPAWWRRVDHWIDEFRACLAWGSALGAWNDLKGIAEYPDEDCPVGEHTEDEKAYLCAVAKSIQQRNQPQVVEALKGLTASRHRRISLLAALELAFSAGAEEGLQRAFDEHLQYFAKHDAKQKTIVRVSYEGTFYFHRARAAGMPLLLPDKLADYVIRLNGEH